MESAIPSLQTLSLAAPYLFFKLNKTSVSC